MSDRYLTAEERRLLIREHGHVFGLETLIETGTNFAETPLFLRNDFHRIFTIELSEELWRVAKDRLSPFPWITCILGDSGLVLPSVLGQLQEPAVIWLDGHYCGPGTAHAEGFSTPIREELRILFQDNRPHVILIDDARVFDGGAEHDLYPHYADYPSLEWIEAQAAKHSYRYRLHDDVIRLFPS